jgi:hypothetical protein
MDGITDSGLLLVETRYPKPSSGDELFLDGNTDPRLFNRTSIECTLTIYRSGSEMANTVGAVCDFGIQYGGMMIDGVDCGG